MEQNGLFKYYESIDSKNVEWLWYPYIPYGKLTLLQGDPGDGKSTFALNLASIVTRGGLLPDGSRIDIPQTVIYQCSEDGNEDTIKPRLESAGADCKKIAYIVDAENALTLDDDRIETAVRDTGARFLILDPIQSFMQQDGDMQNIVRVRNIMKKLASVAQKYNCAVLLIGHMNKSTSGKNLYRGMGSIDIAASVRSVLMITKDDHNPEIRYMFPVKASLAPEGEAIGFILDKTVGFQWIGKCRLDVAKMQISHLDSRKDKKEKTKELLKIMLSVDECQSKEIYERMKKFDISERTVRTAQKELGIIAYRKNRTWYWKMPDESEEE